MRDKFSELAMQVREFAKETEKPFYVCMFTDEHLCCSGSNISGNHIVSGCVAALYENLKNNKNTSGAIMKALIRSALSGKYCNDGGFSQKEAKDLHNLIDAYTEEK
jgi:hypothetical protein